MICAMLDAPSDTIFDEDTKRIINSMMIDIVVQSALDDHGIVIRRERRQAIIGFENPSTDR